MKIYAATGNKHKKQELSQLFSPCEIIIPKDEGIIFDPDENGNSFVENTVIKAKALFDLVKAPVIADDSGLCITAFNDWPGVFTHRFLGENATKTDRNNAILDKMKDLKEERDAKVVCNLVYYDGVNTIIGEGIINGKISLSLT